MDRHGLAVLRAELVGGLRGEVVEIGCGNGRNVPHYPNPVTAVYAIEPEPYLRKLATQAAPMPLAPPVMRMVCNGFCSYDICEPQLMRMS